MKGPRASPAGLLNVRQEIAGVRVAAAWIDRLPPRQARRSARRREQVCPMKHQLVSPGIPAAGGRVLRETQTARERELPARDGKLSSSGAARTRPASQVPEATMAERFSCVKSPSVPNL
jgi:hypothetical protein